MKSGTESKVKFKQLQRLLKLPLYEARGLLDTLWNMTATNAPNGDLGRFTFDEIATGLDWQREPQELIEALVRFKWLDLMPDGRLMIHDWAEHCEYTVHNMLARRTEVFADGTIPSLSRLSSQERTEIIEKYEVKYGKDAVKSGRVPVIAQERSARGLPLPCLALPVPSLAIPSLSQVGAAKPHTSEPPVGDQSDPQEDPDAKDPPDDPPPPAPSCAEDVPIPLALDVPAFRAAVESWFDQRRRRRLSLRPKFIARQYARLEPLGPLAAAACVQYTVDQDYQGLFPEKFGAKKAANADPRGNLAALAEFRKAEMEEFDDEQA